MPKIAGMCIYHPGPAAENCNASSFNVGIDVVQKEPAVNHSWLGLASSARQVLLPELLPPFEWMPLWYYEFQRVGDFGFALGSNFIRLHEKCLESLSCMQVWRVVMFTNAGLSF
jgi:hypothetical protein